MNFIIDTIKNLKGLISSTGATEMEIEGAENILGLTFCEEYRNYLKEFGIIAFSGRELTGLCDSPRTNVINVTLENRKLNDKISNSWYVIEESNIDGLVTWQSENGKVYQTVFGKDPLLLATSFSNYLLGVKPDTVSQPCLVQKCSQTDSIKQSVPFEAVKKTILPSLF